MKTKQLLFTLLLLLGSTMMWAENCEFEYASNFVALTKGPKVLHIKSLAWSHGGVCEYDHWAGDGSYIYYTLASDPNTQHTLVSYHSGNDDGEDGKAYIKFENSTFGTFSLVNLRDDTNQNPIPIDSEKEIHPIHNNSSDNLYIEFEWVTPSDLEEQQFDIWVSVKDKRVIDTETRSYKMGSFTGPQKMQAPTIQNAVFYPQDKSGRSLVATAAVPYTTYQKPYSYYFNQDSTYKIATNDMGGLALVQMEDSSRESFSLTFSLQYALQQDITTNMTTNVINIPPYHKIHDFQVSEWVNPKNQQCKGYNCLSWNTYYGGDRDIVPNDMFVIERASKADFSDAQQIGSVNMVLTQEGYRKDTVFKYTYIDSTAMARKTIHPDSLYWYYRISRATARNWKTDTLYHKTGKVQKRVHLPILVAEQPKIDTLSSYPQDYAVRIHAILLGEDLPNGLSSYWAEGTKLQLQRVVTDVDNQSSFSQKIIIDNSAIVQDSIHPRLWHAYYEDHVAQPCTRYTYTISVNTSAALLYMPKDQQSITIDGTTYTAIPQQSVDGVILTDDKDNFFHTGLPEIVDFAASQAVFANRILVRWNAVAGGHISYQLERKHPSETQWQTIGQSPSLQSPYSDTSVTPGEEFQYRLTVISTCGEDSFTTTKTCQGATSYYGHISGHIRLGDGTAEAGTCVKAMVNNDTIAMTYTDEKGYYILDSIDCREDLALKVMPISNYSSYHYGNSSEGIASIAMSPGEPYHDNIDFTNAGTVRFSGRVLYSNSTVPVANAYFRVNGAIVHDRSGNVIKTETDGSFVFSIPSNTPLTIQTEKPGHTFDNNGFFQMESLTEAGVMTDTLNFSKNVDGRRMPDLTRVVLRGRIVGGRVQGNLPLGQYLSKNNLGDNLNFVLELEGDNISHLVHSTDNTLHEIDKIYTDTTADEMVHSTHMHMTESRITITVDSATGEFRAEVIPTRYKVVQMNAQGYATLFNNGQTSFSLDLSAAKDTADFVHIYHSPIEVGLKQYEYGVIEQSFFGIDKVRQQDAAGNMTILPLLTAHGDTIDYAFDYPVFSEGEYYIQVSAHEDYYYNNDRHGEHDQVMLGNHDVKVFNGLESETREIVTRLDSTGITLVRICAANPTFSLTDEQALKSFSVSVLVDGDYVESANLRAFVTGSRTKENTFEAELGTAIVLDEIVRDPYGANSYAYLESGSSFSASYSSTWDIDFGATITLGFGTSFASVTGVGTPVLDGVIIDQSQVFTGDIPLVNSWHFTDNYNYSRTVTNRISTSSDPYHVGSNADVYTGTEIVKMVKYNEAFRILNDSMYQALAPAFAIGSAHLIRKGQVVEGNDTTRYYLVTGDEMVPGLKAKSTFAYTQEHIVKTIIPNLIRNRNSLLIVADSTTAKNLANATKKEVYRSLVPVNDSNFGNEPASGKTFYEVIYPDDKSTGVNKVQDYNSIVSQWLIYIANNERVKMEVGGDVDLLATYDISSMTTISHSESTSWSSAASYISQFFCGTSGSIKADAHLGGLIQSIFKGAEEAEQILEDIEMDDLSSDDGKENESSVAAPGMKFIFNIKPVLNYKQSLNNPVSHGKLRNIGFVLDAGDGNYLSQSVYRVENDTISRLIATDGKNYLDEFGDKILTGQDRSDNLRGLDLVYRLNGGATHCPYIGADSSLRYPGQLLSNATLRIDNPMMSLDKHVVSNVPDGQPAVFVLTMVNETEVNPATYTSATPNTFTLFQPSTSNKNGATILMDGMPITDGRVFALNPGDRTTKRLEVYRGQGYDFEDIELILRNTCDVNNLTKIQLAVHYLPSSCDVKISSPTDKWVMNTLSPRDTIGYYIPVVIDGFDSNWPEFDHIEFQYKLTTDPDEKWVNQCSYYTDPERMAECSGNHALIEGGRIANIRFYGERDPMEQQYDLRAVSFTRHGSGFITKSSPVLTGIKDTRPPQIFGLPSPADQILHFDQFIEIPFSEPIAGNYLDEDNNFSMLAYTNSSSITDGTSLDFSGSKDAYAISSAGRTLNQKSFTIDMMVRPNRQKQAQTLFCTGSQNKQIQFGLNDNGCLYAKVNGIEYVSEDPGIINNFVRLLMVYNQEDSTLHFYMGNEEKRIVSDWGNKCVVEGEKSPFCFGAVVEDSVAGNNFAGRMMEVRVWSKALTPAQITLTNMRRLTGYEEALLAYYPMNEGRDDRALDQANGAHLILHSLAWSNPDGLSVHITGNDLNGEGIRLRDDVLSRSEDQDMTLSFWFRLDTILQKTDTMTLYATGLGDGTEILADQHLFVGLMGSRLIVRHNGIVQEAGMVTDAEWHRFALTLNRANNVGNVFLDGDMVKQFDAHEIGGISDMAYLGACHYYVYDEDYNKIHKVRYPFSGYFDQFQLWEQSLSPDFQQRFAETAPTGTEMGLLVYLPMHRLIETEQGEMMLVFSPYNAVIPNGQTTPSMDSVILTDVSMHVDKVEYAPVRANDKLSKLRFSWVARNTNLVVNLNMQDAELNKNTVYMTIRDVKDLNGNPMVSPLSWNIYMDRNRLRWSDRTLDIEIPYNSDTTITTTVINNSGVYTGYTISSLAPWISAITPQGYLTAADEQRTQLYISNSLAPGEYSTTLYLTDQNGLSEPLNVNLRVYTLMPSDWVINPQEKYNTTMTLVGEVWVSDNGVSSVDTSNEDVVAAFVGNKCVGVQKNSFKNNKSGLYMTIHGNDAIKDKKVEFRLWRARTGRIYDLITSVSKITYKPNVCYGCDAVVLLRTKVANDIQTLSMQNGWNWISFNVAIEEGANLNQVLTSSENLSSGDQIKSMLGTYLSDYSTSHSMAQWVVANSNEQLTHTNAYMFRSANGGEVQVRGAHLADEDRCLPLKPGWNELPYLSTATQSVKDAMADYFDNAVRGEVIKNYSSFAVFTSDNGWVGSLEYMRPGEGYMINRLGMDTVDFCYVNNGSDLNKPLRTPTRMFRSSTCMPMILNIKGIELQDGDQLLVTNANNGEYAAELTDAKPVARDIYMVAHAEEGDVMHFALVRDGEVIAQSTTELIYNSRSVAGNVKAPFVIDFTESETRKILRDDQVLILRQNEVYNMFGTKLQ